MADGSTFVPAAVTIFHNLAQLKTEDFQRFGSAFFRTINQTVNQMLPTLQTGMSFMQLLSTSGSAINPNLNLPGTAVKSSNQNVIVSSYNQSSGESIARGYINADGTTNSGLGFSAVNNSTGNYTVTLTNAFLDTPTVLIQTTGVNSTSNSFSVTTNSFQVGTRNSAGTAANIAFMFMAIGERST